VKHMGLKPKVKERGTVFGRSLPHANDSAVMSICVKHNIFWVFFVNSFF